MESIINLKGADRVRKRPLVFFQGLGIDGYKSAIKEIIKFAVEEIGKNEADADPPATDGCAEIGENEANDETKDEDLTIEYEAFVIHPAVLDAGQVQVIHSAAEANAVLDSYDALMKGEIEIFLSLKESALEKILTQWMDFYMSSAKVFGSIDAHSFEEYTLVLVGIRRPSLDEPTVELNMKDGKLQLDIGIQSTEMNMDSQSGLASTLAVWVKRTDIVSVETTTNWSNMIE